MRLRMRGMEKKRGKSHNYLVICEQDERPRDQKLETMEGEKRQRMGEEEKDEDEEEYPHQHQYQHQHSCSC